MPVVSYSVEVLNNTKEILNAVANTMAIYNEALNYVINVVQHHYNDISDLDSLNARMYIEHLIHNTKNNKALYDFDSKFYKLPCYLLRDIEAKAIGHVSSYISNLENYKKDIIVYLMVRNIKRKSLLWEYVIDFHLFIRIICILRKMIIYIILSYI